MSERTIRFFDEMNILQSEKDKRIASCDFLEEKLKYHFSWFRKHDLRKIEYENGIVLAIVLWMLQTGYMDEEEVQSISDFLGIYEITIEKLGIENPENIKPVNEQRKSSLERKIEEYKDKIVNENRKNPDNEYYTSEDRAYYIARDYTNKIYNDMAHDNAVKQGLKFHVWRTERDKYVRKSHLVAEGQIQRINEPFNIGGYQMLYPMDDSFGANMDEIAGCRCVEEFF